MTIKTPYELAAHYKASDVEKQASYGLLVRDTNFNPGMEAAEFFSIFDAVSPKLLSDTRPLKAAYDHWLLTNSFPMPVQVVDRGYNDGVLKCMSDQAFGVSTTPISHVKFLLKFSDVITTVDEIIAVCEHCCQQLNKNPDYCDSILEIFKELGMFLEDKLEYALKNDYFFFSDEIQENHVLRMLKQIKG